jgi:hypothetical protein
MSKPEDAAVLQAIFEDDRTNRGTERDGVVSKRSSVALDAVTISKIKNRLKKHLSTESVFVSKRNSRSSVGTSEEEVERRAELRRIRHKRIQDELSNEGIYDEDAKSISTTGAAADVSPGEQGAGGRSPGLPDWIPGQNIPLPELDLPLLTPPSFKLRESASQVISGFGKYDFQDLLSCMNEHRIFC